MAAWNDPGWSTTAAALPTNHVAQHACQPPRLGSSRSPTHAAAAAAAAAANPLSALAAAAEEEQEQEEQRHHAQAQPRAAAPPLLPSAGTAAAAALLLRHAEAQQRAGQGVLGVAPGLRPLAPAAVQRGQQLHSPCPHTGGRDVRNAGSSILLATAAAAIACAAAAAVPGEAADMLQVLLATDAQGQAPHPTAVAAAMLAAQREQQKRRQAAAQQLLLSLLAGLPWQPSQPAAAGGFPPQAQQQRLAPAPLPPPQALRPQGPQGPHRQALAEQAAAATSMEHQQRQQAAVAQAVRSTAPWQPRQAVPTPLQTPPAGVLPAAPAGRAWGGFPVTTGVTAGPLPCLRARGHE